MAGKVITLKNCVRREDRKEFQRRYLYQHSPLLLQLSRRLVHLAITVMDVTPEIPVAKIVGPVQTDFPLFDLATELWFETMEDFWDPARMFDSPGAGSLLHEDLVSMGGEQSLHYVVEESVQWDRMPKAPMGERTEGIKVFFIAPAEKQGGSGGGRNWLDMYAECAAKEKVCSRYIRNKVIENHKVETPLLEEIAEMCFSTSQDLQRFYRFVADRTVSWQTQSDVLALHGSEYRLR